MKLGSFLNLDEEGFHIGKISAPDIRPEDVLGYLKSRGISPIIYIPDYIARYVALPAIAYSLLNHLDGDFFLGLGGMFGTVFQSLLPAEDIPGQYDVYPDIDENVVFYVLAKAMDYVAEKYEKPIIWIFGRVDFARDYLYVRFLHFLKEHDRLAKHSHMCIAVGESAESLPFEELSIEGMNIRPAHTFDDIMAKPFTERHKKVIGVLALVSSISSAHITVSFVARFINHFPWVEDIMKDLLDGGVLEQYSDNLYSFTSYRFYKYVLENWIDNEVRDMALHLMRRSARSNMRFVAYLADKEGDGRKAIGTITIYAMQLISEGRYRKAYREILNIYKKYRQYLTPAKLRFYLYLASTTDFHDKEFTSYVVKRLLEGGHIKETTYLPLALVMEESEENVAFWQSVYERSMKESSPLKKQMMLLGYFEYMWKIRRITAEEMKTIYENIKCQTVRDTFLSLLILSSYGRLLTAIGSYSKAIEILDKAEDLITTRKLWFRAGPVFNNLFVSLYRSKKDYLYVRYIPLLFAAIQTTLLYRSSRAAVGVSNYLIILAHSSRPFNYVLSIFREFSSILRVVYDDKILAQVYYAMSFVVSLYGYYNLAIEYIENIRKLYPNLDEAPYQSIFNYYHVKAFVLMVKGELKEALNVVEEFKEKYSFYAEAEEKVKSMYNDIAVIQGRRKPDTKNPFFVYKYYISKGDIKGGIDSLKELYNNLRKTGDLLSMGHAKKFLAHLYEIKGDVASMQEALYDATAIYYILEAAEVVPLAEKALIDPSNIPVEMVRLYINRMIVVDVLTDIIMESTVVGAMEKVLSNIVVPATGLWMFFSWENFSRFIGFTVTKGVTQKFKEFYVSPFDIDVSGGYVFSESPSYIAVSSRIGESNLIIYAENRYVEGVFSYDDINSLKMYADILIGILVKMKLGERALIDSLTGVYTRWYILKQLEKEIYRYTRTGSPLSVLFIDVDDFKRINDSYGHDVGDKVLEYVGRTIKGQLRIVDLVGRYGGEEFLVILPDTDEEGAYTAAERIRSAIESQRVFPFSVTVSIGIVTLRDYAISPAEVIRYADVAMYMAKKLGKNRTWVYKYKTKND